MSAALEISYARHTILPEDYFYIFKTLKTINSNQKVLMVKVHCSVLAEQAIRAALADYYTKKGIDPTPIVGKIDKDCHGACSLEH